MASLPLATSVVRNLKLVRVERISRSTASIKQLENVLFSSMEDVLATRTDLTPWPIVRKDVPISSLLLTIWFYVVVLVLTGGFIVTVNASCCLLVFIDRQIK
ncbi:hypothetical protein OESDEN_17155 [Oesophagostomum dentatum]|uniref:Uncharacterized protein n=1 Tax=Oesophagostomum dentatum TaxID=61180 RepID=A0A0B1SD08_OESDE|nr:hypothetical protein OESDEN_17155 [Oesophagostomum dentatum]